MNGFVYKQSKDKGGVWSEWKGIYLVAWLTSLPCQRLRVHDEN